MTFKFDGWPWKKNPGYLFYATSTLLHHLIAISESKPYFGSKSEIFLSHVTLKFDGWPWKTIGHHFYATSSFVHHFIAMGTLNSGENRHFWSRVTLKFYGWPWKTIGYTHSMLCASFHCRCWIQTGVTVRKRPIRVKMADFLSDVTLKFNGWPWKRIGHLFYAAASFMHHFIVISEFKLESQSGNAQFGSKSEIFCPVWPWNLMNDLEKQYGTSSMLLQALCIIS